ARQIAEVRRMAVGACQIVARRLVVVVGGERGLEAVPAQLAPDEERVDPAQLAADQGISVLLAEALEGLEAGASSWSGPTTDRRRTRPSSPRRRDRWRCTRRRARAG